MKAFIRNFVYTCCHFRMATVLNIIGLSVAFAAFLILMMQVRHEQSFDRCHPAVDRIFCAEFYHTEDGSAMVIFPRAFPEVFVHSSPHIEAGTLFNPYGKEIYLSVTENGQKKGFREAFTTCFPDIVRVFDFPILEGDPDCLKAPEMVIIPESLAKRLFKNESAVGRQIQAEETIWTKSEKVFTIGAVYRDFPENTQLKNHIYTAIDQKKSDTQDWGGYNFYCFVRLDHSESAEKVAQSFNRNFDFSLLGESGSDMQLRLIPLTDLYYTSMKEVWGGDSFRTGNRHATRLLLFIALLILAMAGINYMNFSTALTPMRVRSINTQKILGGSEAVLRFSLMAEAVGICLLAYLLALGWVHLLGESRALSFIEADIRLSSHLSLLIEAGGIACLVGLAAGCYPSFYITSFPPAVALKGNFGLSPSGRRLRTTLIGFQYVVSIGLIVGACIIQLQNYYMRHYKLGFNKDQVALVELNSDFYKQHRETYVNRLTDYPGIEGVAFSFQKMGGQDAYSLYQFSYREQQFNAEVYSVSPSFLTVMGIPVRDGGNFPPNSDKENGIYFIFNESARKMNALEVGETIDMGWGPGKIIGFTDDVIFTSLRENIQPAAFVVAPRNSLTISYIRLKAGTAIDEATAHIRKVIAELDPSYPVEIKFYDTVYNELYQKEEFIKTLVTLSSLLAIIISIMGVFGLVVFETQYRRREIGIRKVYGATISDILGMFNKRYFYVVVVCFILATPVTWWGVKKWLENFAYKTPLHWWIFALAFAIVAVVTLVTVSFQNWRAAVANPVDSIQTE